MNNIRTYLRGFCCGVSNVFVPLGVADCTVPAIAMLSVRDTEIATMKFSPKFEHCSCWLLLVLPNTLLLIYLYNHWPTSDPDRPAVWWPHWPEILPTILTVQTAHTLRLCCVFRYCKECCENWGVLMVHVMYRLGCVNGSSNVQFGVC
jgi:hypothetical protein